MHFLYALTHVRLYPLFLLILYHACGSCNSLDHHCAPRPTHGTSSVIGFNETRDLELVCSHESHPGVFASIARNTLTVCGNQKLSLRLTNPVTDRATIQLRQQQITFLHEHPELLATMREALTTIAHTEAALTYFSERQEDPLVVHALSNFYFQSPWLTSLNQSALALDARNYVKYLGLFGPVVEHLLFHFALEYLEDMWRTPTASHHDHHVCSHDHGHHHHHSHACIHHITPAPSASSLVKGALSLLKMGHFTFHAISVAQMIEHIASERTLLNGVHQQVVAARACLLEVRKVLAIARIMPGFFEAFGLPSTLADSLYDRINHPDLVALLQHEDFYTGSLDSFSRMGQTLAAHRTLTRHAGLLATITQALGDLDASQAVVGWYHTATAMYPRACLVDFIVGHEAPSLYLEDLWHIALPPQTVVPNTVALHKDEGLHLIITGPNKAGKSSILKAVGINIILAQSYGVAAARRAMMPIFHKVLTHIVVTDNILHHQSTMVSELMRLQTYLQVIHDLQDHQYACLLVDDSLLRGTHFEQGQELAYQFMASLSKIPHCVSIVATHMPLLTTLADACPHHFQNYFLGTTVDVGGAVSSTFRLAPGVSDPDHVFDIVKSEGYLS